MAGCGNNIKVGGKVTFPDGTPLHTGTVIFETASHQFVGYIQPDGTYTVSGMKIGDGLPAGIYQIAVTGTSVYEFIPSKNPNSDTAGQEIEKRIVDQKYESPSTSGLTFEVTPNDRVFNITVEKPVEPVKRRR